ncbi:MAG: hypothetical protein ACRCTI_18090 [Beijerinckiaceae bacterium]
MQLDLRNLLLGFIAGALSVVIFHQGMALILHLLGQTPNFPWNTAPMRGGLFSLPIPMIVNSMFWGGLWGVGFALFAALIPVANTVLKGIVYGLIGPYLLGNAILVPFFKGGPYFWGGQPPRIILGALIGGAFGAGLALIYGFLARR